MGNVKIPKYYIYNRYMGVGFVRTYATWPVYRVAGFHITILFSETRIQTVTGHYELIRYYRRDKDIFLYKLMKEEIK